MSLNECNIYFTYLLRYLSVMTQSKKNSDDKMTDPSIRRLFEGKNFVFVSTLMDDGRPQITPTWVDLEEQDGGDIIINKAGGRGEKKKISKKTKITITR